jgi:hypothetical protein
MTMRCLSYTWHSAQSYDNEVSFLCLTLSPVLWQWGIIPILDTQPSLITMRCHSYAWPTASLITMRCHSYTWHPAHSYNNEVSFLYLTHSPVLWQWGVIPILDTQPSLMTMRCHSYTWHSAPSLMTMRCHSYTWHSAQSYDNEVSFLYLTPSLRLMTKRCHSYTWHSAPRLMTLRLHYYTWA